MNCSVCDDSGFIWALIKEEPRSSEFVFLCFCGTGRYRAQRYGAYPGWRDRLAAQFERVTLNQLVSRRESLQVMTDDAREDLTSEPLSAGHLEFPPVLMMDLKMI